MELPVQITFRNMSPSDAVTARIREEVAKLETFCESIMACRVVVEIPHRRFYRGKLFHIRIDLTVPGEELVVNHQPSLHTLMQSTEIARQSKDMEVSAPCRDVYVSIRDAFDAARRKLQACVGRRRRMTKAQAAKLLTSR
ncbi:MAG: ribosome-associated translation inhibitor RaiA [Acidobacteria bacterium]|nr:ribosome-associated translation inhibitor RaiA [Acidobacteriota bacterium]